MNVNNSAGPGTVSSSSSEKENVEKDPSIMSEASKTENVAKNSIPVNQDSPEDFDLEIGRVSKPESDKQTHDQASSLDSDEEQEKATDEKPVQQEGTEDNGSGVTATSNKPTDKYPARSKQKEWVTLAVTTSAAAAGILSVLGASFMVASLIGGITIFPFVAWIIAGVVGGVSCGLLLGFREPIVGGIDKLISKMH